MFPLPFVTFKTHNRLNQTMAGKEPTAKKELHYLQHAAHDLKSPLNTILGMSNLLQHMLQDDPMDKKELAKIIDLVKTSCNQALDLTSDILEMAELDSDHYELPLHPIILHDFVRSYIYTHRLMLLKKRIHLQFEADTYASILMNESKITRVLDNIISNAVKFSYHGTNIWIRLIGAGTHVHLSVRDEGIGMSEKMVEDIFERFRGHQRRGLDGEVSHGLGMTIVKQIMDLHQADTEVRSEEGKGTEVILKFKKLPS